MTEGDWNLMLKMIESRLERESASRCDGRGVEAVVGARWLASVLVENEHLRHQVTDLQRSNTALEARARTAEADALCMRDVVKANGGSSIVDVVADARRERDAALANSAEVDARLAHLGFVLDTGSVGLESVGQAARRVVRERDEARAALATEVEAGKQFAAYLTKVLDVGSAGLESIGLAAKRVVRERDEARAALSAAREDIAALRSAAGDTTMRNVYDVVADMCTERDAAVADRERMRVERDKAANETVIANCAAAELRTKNSNLLANFRTENEARRAAEAERDEMRAVRDEALKAVDSVTASRDALAVECNDTKRALEELARSFNKMSDACAVPPELARLWWAAQGARAKYHQAAQAEKLLEECGEYITERSRVAERYDWAKVNHEIHDVLTVALSLCEPALMAKAAERLEGRLK